MNDFNFCPECGSKNIRNVQMRKWLCPDCGFDLYNNVASAVGLIIKDSQGNVLLEKRAKEPRKGFLALPGGFVDPGETAEEACFRECKEELGVMPVSVKYLCSFPNTYEYKNIVYKTCDLFFEAVLPDNCTFKPQESEVLSLDAYSIRNLKELEELPLAFESAKKTFEVWLKKTAENDN